MDGIIADDQDRVVFIDVVCFQRSAKCLDDMICEELKQFCNVIAVIEVSVP